jgi:hypothetical protein
VTNTISFCKFLIKIADTISTNPEQCPFKEGFRLILGFILW